MKRKNGKQKGRQKGGEGGSGGREREREEGFLLGCVRGPKKPQTCSHSISHLQYKVQTLVGNDTLVGRNATPRRNHTGMQELAWCVLTLLSSWL